MGNIPGVLDIWYSEPVRPPLIRLHEPKAGQLHPSNEVLNRFPIYYQFNIETVNGLEITVFLCAEFFSILIYVDGEIHCPSSTIVAFSYTLRRRYSTRGHR